MCKILHLADKSSLMLRQLLFGSNTHWFQKFEIHLADLLCKLFPIDPPHNWNFLTETWEIESTLQCMCWVCVVPERNVSFSTQVRHALLISILYAKNLLLKNEVAEKTKLLLHCLTWATIIALVHHLSFFTSVDFHVCKKLLMTHLKTRLLIKSHDQSKIQSLDEKKRRRNTLHFGPKRSMQSSIYCNIWCCEITFLPMHKIPAEFKSCWKQNKKGHSSGKWVDQQYQQFHIYFWTVWSVHWTWQFWKWKHSSRNTKGHKAIQAKMLQNDSGHRNSDNSGKLTTLTLYQLIFLASLFHLMHQSNWNFLTEKWEIESDWINSPVHVLFQKEMSISVHRRDMHLCV